MFLLGDWGDLSATPALHQALILCWQQEREQAQQNGDLDTGKWHALQHGLAYTLGQLEAWDILMALPYPPGHGKIAFLYFLSGTLHPLIQKELARRDQRFSASLYSPDDPSCFDYRYSLVSEQQGFLLQQRNEMLFSPYLDLTHIYQVLQAHFGSTPEDQRACLQQCWQAYAQRTQEDGRLWPEPAISNVTDLFLDY